MEKFTLINKDKSRIKVFRPFEDLSKPSASINVMEIVMDVFTRDLANQLWREVGLKVLRLQGQNIRNY